MHNAPAVSYPVGRSLFQGGLLAAVTALTALAWLFWAWAGASLQGWHLGAVAGWLLVTGAAAWQWWQTPTAALSWDGSEWTWSDAQSVKRVQPEVVLDWQSGLLLRLRDRSGGQLLWVWPERHSAGSRWLALRRAVFSPSAAEVGA